MSVARTQLELYQRLNTELVSMIDHFTNLVKATKEGLEADEAPSRPESGAVAGAPRERRVPGELLEVSVEKLLAAGHQCVHTVSELKKGAIFSDMDSLLASVNQLNTSLADDTKTIDQGLSEIRRQAEGLLSRLEGHYYSCESSSRGPLPARKGHPATASLAELCGQALQMIDDLRGQQ